MPVFDIENNVAGIYDPDCGHYRFFRLPHMMFGSLAAIYAAVETGSWISLVCRRLLRLVFMIYIDDGMIVIRSIEPLAGGWGCGSSGYRSGA